jgi:hypothetical protein
MIANLLMHKQQNRLIFQEILQNLRVVSNGDLIKKGDDPDTTWLSPFTGIF